MAANSQAAALGGHLVTCTSRGEDTFARQLWRDTQVGDYWIGLSDSAIEGQFVWVTGEVFSFSNWDAGQPDNAGALEDFVTGDFGEAGGWNDNRNSAIGPFVGGFILEYDSANQFLTKGKQFADTSDVFVGSDLADIIVSGFGNDTLDGGAGRDKLTGGDGNDLFVFAAYDGKARDTVVDFDDAGDDQIRLIAFGFTNGDEVLAKAVQSRQNIIIDLNGIASILLQNTDLASLTVDDFVIS